MTAEVTLKCLDCGKEFQTEHVSLMGQMFFAERYCSNCLFTYRGTDLLPITEGRTKLQTTAMIKEVTKRNIEPKSGAAPFTLFEIEDSDGTKWTTKKQGLALEAHSLVGKMASIDGTIKENGQYKNYYLEGITEAGNLPAALISENGHSASNLLPATVDVRDTSGNRDEQIWRQTACKVAAVLSDDPVSFWENVDRLLNYFRTGEHPGQEEQTYATASTFTGDDNIPF
jgi:hypothetical protein